MHRQAIVVAAWALATALIAGPAVAQRPGPPGGPPRAGGPGGPPTPASILDEMSKRLNLTAPQKAKIKPLLEAEQKELTALFSDQSTPRDQKMGKFRSLRDSYQAKINKVLTPAQLKKQ